MTVSIRGGKFRLKLWCPLALLGFVVKIAAKYAARDGGIALTAEQIKGIKSKLKEAKRTFGHMELICAESSDGDRVRIVL